MASDGTVPQTLANVRILSLALNLPGPAALMRCRAMGATCVKLEAPGPAGAPTDPMARYAATAYAEMHEGVRHVHADLKTPDGRATLADELAQALRRGRTRSGRARGHVRIVDACSRGSVLSGSRMRRNPGVSTIARSSAACHARLISLRGIVTNLSYAGCDNRALVSKRNYS